MKRPGRLLNFWTLRVGAYSSWALIKFSRLSANSKFTFVTKQQIITKCEDVPKQNFNCSLKVSVKY